MSKLKRWDFVQEVTAIYKLGLEVASREKIFAPFFFSQGALPPNTLRFKGRATWKSNERIVINYTLVGSRNLN